MHYSAPFLSRNINGYRGISRIFVSSFEFPSGTETTLHYSFLWLLVREMDKNINIYLWLPRLVTNKRMRHVVNMNKIGLHACLNSSWVHISSYLFNLSIFLSRGHLVA